MIEKKDIEKLADLSRLKLSDKEKVSFEKDINTILDYITQISEVASESTPPEVGDVRNIMRTDDAVIEPGAYTEDILKEAPQRNGDYVEVKKIL